MRRFSLALVPCCLAIQLAPRPARLGPCPCPCCALSPAPPLALASTSEENPISAGAVAFLRWYKQALSPLLPPGCRFVPTCSEYAIQSFERFPPLQAAVLTAWRLVRCNPTAGSGVDEPRWPPPAYWAGDGSVRSPLDDERSRRRALGEDVDARPFAERLEGDDPFAVLGTTEVDTRVDSNEPDSDAARDDRK